MGKRYFNEHNQLVIDEYELHDIISSGIQTYLGCTSFEDADKLWDGSVTVKLEIDNKDLPQQVREELCAKWQRKIDELTQLMGRLDGELHDDMGYTC